MSQNDLDTCGMLMGNVKIWGAFVFLVAIFVGDVYIGITVPIAVLLLPILFFIPFRFVPARLLALLLIAMSAPVLARIAIEVVPTKRDLTVYLPVIYGALALSTVPTMQTEKISSGILWGCSVTAAIMIVFAVVVPSDTYVIPGQEFWKTDADYASERGLALSRESEGADDPQILRGRHMESSADMPKVRVFDGKLSSTDIILYGWKNKFKNFLGLSNYVAAFFVFGMTIALFSSQYIVAAVLGAAIAVTMSRFGIMFGFTAVAFWAARRFGVPKWILLACLAGGTGIVVLAIVLIPDVMPTSIRVRADYWQAGARAVSESPLLGWNRSSLLSQMGWAETWNPHNLFLWVTVYTGMFGLALYLAYLGFALKVLSDASRVSPVFEGVLMAVTICLAWSMFEPIAMTPAFELILATVIISAYATSHAAAKSPEEHVQKLALARGKL